MEQWIILCTTLTGELLRLVIKETKLPVVRIITTLRNYKLKAVHLPNVPR